MTLQTLPAPFRWPGLCNAIGIDLASASAGAVDAAAEYLAVVIAAREAMTISHVGFRTATASTGNVAEMRIETVGTDGLPSGTLWAANTNVNSDALSNNTFQLKALAAAASIAAGQAFAVKFAFNTGNFTVAQITEVRRYSNLPYRAINTTGTPAKSALVSALAIALGSSASAFYCVEGLWPFSSVAQNAFNNTDDARRGVRFQVPFKCRAVGLSHYDSSAVGDHSVVLLDDSGNELSSSSTAYDGNLSAEAANGVHNFYFDNPVTLSPGTWYRMAIVPSSATNINITTLTLPSADYRSAYPGGTNFFYATFTTAGGWVDSATDQVPPMDLWLDQLDDGAGAGGGLLAHPGMRGGMI